MPKTKDVVGRITCKSRELSPKILVCVFRLLKRLAGKNGGSWYSELAQFLQKKTCWTGDIFECGEVIIIPRTKENFIVKEKFILDPSKDAMVKFSYLDPDFAEKHYGTREYTDGGPYKIRYYTLRENSQDIRIVTELNRRLKYGYELWLSLIFSLLQKQPSGEDGLLLTNGKENLFIIPYTFYYGGYGAVIPVQTILSLVWDKNGWRLVEFPIGCAFNRARGIRIFAPFY